MKTKCKILSCYLLVQALFMAYGFVIHSDTVTSSQKSNKNILLRSTSCPAPVNDDSIDAWMPDKKLQSIVAQALKISVSQITQIQMANLQSLDCDGRGVTNIQGLEYAVNLQILNLSNNNIQDIHPLENLNKVSTLTIINDQINDISALSGMKSLYKLQCFNNQISDISALKDLSSLRIIQASQNKIQNVSPLSALTNLQELDLGDNQIQDISSLKDLTNLTSLRFYNNQVEDISALSGFEQLNELYAYKNKIHDISAISKLDKLSALSIYDNKIDNISELSTLSNLTLLSLYNNLIVDLKPLEKLQKLQALNIANDDVSDLSPIKNITGLTYLTASGNKIADISPIKNLTALKALSLDNQAISLPKAEIFGKDYDQKAEVKDIEGSLVSLIPDTTYHGVYEKGIIHWTDLPNLTVGKLEATWSQNITVGASVSAVFSGKLSQDYETKTEPDYYISIPDAINLYTDNKTEANIKILNKDMINTYDGEKKVEAKINSQNAFTLLTDSQQSLTYNFEEISDAFGVLPHDTNEHTLGTLSKTETDLEANIWLTESTQCSGNFKDVLTYSFHEVN